MNIVHQTLAASLLVFFYIGIDAQVVINEFSCSNYTLNVGGDNEDFIEFYNLDAIAGAFISRCR